MNAMQRAEAWVREPGKARAIRAETNSGWGSWMVTLTEQGVSQHGGGPSQMAAAAEALRRVGVTDFGEVSP